jgi:hypothetical protein
MIFLLKGGKPEKYKERQEVKINVSELTDEELSAIANSKG